MIFFQCLKSILIKRLKVNNLSVATAVVFLLCSLSHLTPSTASFVSEKELQLEGGYLIRHMKASDIEQTYAWQEVSSQLSDGLCSYGSVDVSESLDDFKQEITLDLIVKSHCNSVLKSDDPENEHYLIFKGAKCMGYVELSVAEELEIDDFELPINDLRDTIKIESNVIGTREILCIEPLLRIEGEDHAQQAQYLLGHFIEAYIKPRLGVSISAPSAEEEVNEDHLNDLIEHNKINELSQLISQMPTKQVVYVGAYLMTHPNELLYPILSSLNFNIFRLQDPVHLHFIDSSYNTPNLQQIPLSIIMARHGQSLLDVPFKNSGIYRMTDINLSTTVAINTGEIHGRTEVNIDGSILVDNSFGIIKGPLVKINSPLFYPGKIYANKLLLNGQPIQPTGAYPEK